MEADQAIALVFDSSVDVLRQLDSEKLFGTGFDRSQLVLGVWMGDQSDEERTEFVRQLNSAAVARRFAKELEDGYNAFTKLSQ